MEFKNVYVSSNCNQTPTAADCNQNNIIAYGACNSVLIYDPQFGSGGKVVHTLIAHSKRVNSVRWIRGNPRSNDQELISGSGDGTLVVWSLKEDRYEPTYLKDDNCKNMLSINIVDGYYDGDRTVVCCAAMNQYTLRIWQRHGDAEFSLHQCLFFGSLNNPSLCVGLRMGMLPWSKKLILACALDNSKIELIVENCLDNQWFTTEKLTGHEDWVRGLDFTTDENGNLLLASGSQDSFIRLWQIIPVQNPDEENITSQRLKIYLESVLAGHEGWVYSLNWSSTSMQLLSASIDKSMIIWELDKASAGAINSAQLLMLSGIGPKEHLDQLEIPVKANLPVGQNLNDHVMFIGINFRTNHTIYGTNLTEQLLLYTKHKRPLTSGFGAEMVGYTNFGQRQDKRPEIQIIFTAPAISGAQRKFFLGLGDEYTAVFDTNPSTDFWPILALLHPKSRGTVTLKSKDPKDKPIIDPNHLCEEEDIETIYKGVQFLIELNNTEVFREYGAEIVIMDYPNCENFAKLSEEWWKCGIRHLATTMFHLTSTNKMGPDPSVTVVDPKLRVHGIGCLRVADSSILPEVISGNTMASTIMVGEKSSDLIKEDYGKL